MDRAFASGASGTPPTAPASPSIGYPTKGNAGTGTPATKPGEYWYHMITEEMRAVIAAAGLTPSQSDLTQLLQALPGALASRPEMARSLAASGYQKLPSGLIIQWGVSNNVSVNPQTVTLPIAFPNQGLVAVASDLSGSFTPTVAILICSARFLSNSQIQTATAGTASSLSPDSLQWIAFGY